jgi:hypothetical protein
MTHNSETRCATLIKRLSLLVVLFVLASGFSIAQRESAAPTNRDLQRELLKMEESDQEYRNQIMELEKRSSAGNLQAKEELKALWKKQEQSDRKNMNRLEEIIKKHGWPGKSLVGADGSLAAFLILQHADVAYQKKYFNLLKEAVGKHEAKPSFAAYLEDRILMRDGKKQIYGTQIRTNEVTKKLELYPIEDEANVDKRRASVGLEPLAQYLRHFGLEYKPPKER